MSSASRATPAAVTAAWQTLGGPASTWASPCASSALGSIGGSALLTWRGALLQYVLQILVGLFVVAVFVSGSFPQFPNLITSL